ncbi:hypothetical protein CRG98_009500 [Punica granatum]|uniref:Uncharacterized protein n=1 Tax=Punica granatum TaxID=22663 RepID=A0A2I0KNG5_PUNGR|nr:hypothetical protein CRG98_009500 [Punica granatum]
MAHNLSLHPSALQLVQNSGNLPMVAKPLYGILSDAFYINGAHRLPYISIGVLLQVLSWGPLALIPSAREALPNLMACVLLSNLGASITEVAMDALVAEYGQRHRANGLQSYAFMASAVGGILGNFLGGYFWPTAASKTMFFTISSSLVWVVSSIAMVPLLSGSIFCYQTQCLHLDPAVLGMSRVVGQLVALSASFLFDRFWKSVTMRKLIGCTQALYAFSLLLDLVLVKQINLRIGIPNEIFVLCFSSLAEAIAQFKLLPFIVLFANLCPRGCEGSLMSFLASALCLSSIVSGFFGVGLASLIGITSGDFSSLAGGILVQFVAAMLPLRWIDRVPASPPIVEKEKKRGRSKRSRRNKRIGRVVLRLLYAYRRERESETLQR